MLRILCPCRERDSNPHSLFGPRDFKSLVSTIPPSRQPFFTLYVVIFLKIDAKVHLLFGNTKCFHTFSGIAYLEDTLISVVVYSSVLFQRSSFWSTFYIANAAVDIINTLALVAFQEMRLRSPHEFRVEVAVRTLQVVGAQNAFVRTSDDESTLMSHGIVVQSFVADGRGHGQVKVCLVVRTLIGGAFQVNWAGSCCLHDAEITTITADSLCQGTAGKKEGLKQEVTIGVAILWVFFAGTQ